MKELQQKIQYQFNDVSLLKQALTHKSTQQNNNERLEFLGDSILSLVVAKQLYTQFPALNEGSLTRLRSQLVSGKTLCAVAQELSLGDFLYLGKAMSKAGEALQCSVLEDAFEALLGAIFLESGFSRTQKVILGIYQSRLVQLTPTIDKDPKTQLQEYLQQYQYPLPTYELVKTTGKDHRATFTIECVLSQPQIRTTQQGHSIKVAQQSCAEIILEKLKKWHNGHSF